MHPDQTTRAQAPMPEPYLPPPSVFGLLIVWSRCEPERVGEVALFPDRSVGAWGLGRSSDSTDRSVEMVQLMRQRPWGSEITGPLADPAISRPHLLVQPQGDHLWVEHRGRMASTLRWDTPLSKGMVSPGDVLVLEGSYVLLCVRRPLEWPRMEDLPRHPFGEADGLGIVGESPAAWKLRRDIHAAAKMPEATLVLGASGVGKELVARALHALSARGKRAWVSRNAATLPESLIESEVFGVAADYPNRGSPERRGLVGEADGGTLFLDEIGELPHELQARLLRLMDSGEYQRLGDARVRRADLRIIGATNRPLDELKHDLWPRFIIQLRVPPLDDRREDIPLVARHRLSRYGRSLPLAPAMVVKLLRPGALPRQVRSIDSELVESLLASSPSEDLLYPVSARPEIPDEGSTEPLDAATASAASPSLVVESGGPLSWGEWGQLEGLRHHRFNLGAASAAGGLKLGDPTQVGYRLGVILLRLWVWQGGDALAAARYALGPRPDLHVQAQLVERLTHLTERLTLELSDDAEPTKWWSKYTGNYTGSRDLGPSLLATLQERARTTP